MDLIKQNKFIGWVIAILIVLNIVSLSIIWIQSKNNNNYPQKDQSVSQPGPVKLIQKEIGMSDEQANKFTEMRKELQEKQRKTTVSKGFLCENSASL